MGFSEANVKKGVQKQNQMMSVFIILRIDELLKKSTCRIFKFKLSIGFVNFKQRKEIILNHYQSFHDPKFLEWDPLIVVRSIDDELVQEFVALYSALMAFGGVKQIIKTVTEIKNRLNISNSFSILNCNEKQLIEALNGFKHRIYVGEDLVLLTLLYQKSVKKFGSLGAHFNLYSSTEHETIEVALSAVIKDFKEWCNEFDFKPGAHFKHMLNSPDDGSTCKRWLMFLKWVVRENDGIDLGLWNKKFQMRPDQLLIPLDTHLFKISKNLGMTYKNTPNFKTAIEITRELKKIDPLYPVKFDFSLCRVGMFDYRKIKL